MLLLLFLLCLISNLCFIKSEDKILLFGVDTDGKCLDLGNYTFTIGDNVNVTLVNKQLSKTTIISVTPEPSNTNKISHNDDAPNSVTISNVTEKSNGKWFIYMQYFKDGINQSASCYVNVKIKPPLKLQIDRDIHLPYLLTIAILITIIIVQSTALLYFICKVRKTQRPKGLTTKEIPPQNDIRYIAGPGIKSKKIVPIVSTDSQSEIYEVPDITLSDQDTLKSNNSIRPKLPLPDEECIYSELPEITNPPAPAFQPPVSPAVRPRPVRSGKIQEKQEMLFSEAQLEPPKPKITPAMLNRAIKPPAAQLNPVPPHKNDNPPTVGRKKDPLPNPVRHNDTLPNPMRHNEPKPPPQRSNDTLPNPMRPNNAFQLPPIARPVPGPSTLKKTLNPVVPVTPPNPGPSTLKKPPKPLPPPTPTEAPPLEQQVQIFNEQRHQLQRESFDEREWDYEPLQQYNIYNI